MAATGRDGAFSPLGALQELRPFQWSAGLVARGMAELRIADAVGDGRRTTDEIAEAVRAHRPSLERFLRVCELHRLVAPAPAPAPAREATGAVTPEPAPDPGAPSTPPPAATPASPPASPPAATPAGAGGVRRWELTPAGHLLRSDVPNLRGFSIAVNAPGMTRPWELVADVVRTGRPATRTVWGMDHWEYYAANPDEARSYAETCASLSVEAAEALVASCDLAEEREIVDVGGSPGTVLARLLREVPGARGVLLDLPWAVGFARETFEKDGLTGRVELVAGDFRHEVPAGGSLYLLKNVLCDLDDEAAAQLLANCAKAADPGGRLVLLDWEYTEHSSHVHANDVEFMVLTGGRARTEDQYRELLTAAGFAHCRRLPLVGHERAPIALIESVRA
ncbi:methyltransferase [Streptomyces roseicoloratus]|uniref:methyltransferase n=1 Tax=Streptomyces roseicoloratus TaxID=2508722 RepID=UPI001009A3CC|nr:methyltransferase [Streptomyces roseicoloratus]